MCPLKKMDLTITFKKIKYADELCSNNLVNKQVDP